MCICTFVICVSGFLLSVSVLLSYVLQGFYCVHICTFAICVSGFLLCTYPFFLSYVFQGLYCVYLYFCHMYFMVYSMCICILSYVFHGFYYI